MEGQPAPHAEEHHEKGGIFSKLFGKHEAPAADQATAAAMPETTQHEVAPAAVAGDVAAVAPGQNEPLNLSGVELHPAVDEAEHHEPAEAVEPAATGVPVMPEEAPVTTVETSASETGETTESVNVALPDSSEADKDENPEEKMLRDMQQAAAESEATTTGSQEGEPVVEASEETGVPVSVEHSESDDAVKVEPGLGGDANIFAQAAKTDGVPAASETEAHPEAPETVAADAAVEAEGVETTAEGSDDDAAQVQEAQAVEATAEEAEHEAQPSVVHPEAVSENSEATSAVDDTPMPDMPIEPQADVSPDLHESALPKLAGSDQVAEEVGEMVAEVGKDVVPESGAGTEAGSESALQPEEAPEAQEKTAEVVSITAAREAVEQAQAALAKAKEALDQAA